MYISNIKNKSLAVLEQTAERYALMAYEVLMQKLATNFKSISFSYSGSEDDGCGSFKATFSPFDRYGDNKWMAITFSITAVHNEDLWVLSDGKIITAIDHEDDAMILFTPDDDLVVEDPSMRSRCFVGNGPNSKVHESLRDIEVDTRLIF